MTHTIISQPTFDRIQTHVENACIGGTSWIRGNDRQSSLSEDQLVGQLGELALHRYMGAEELYFQRRAEIDKNPLVGDGGSDFGCLDVKTSLMRRNKPHELYRLAVRPAEKHDDTIYILALVETLTPPIKVVFVGWAYGFDVKHMSTEGVFNGAYVMAGTELLPMKLLRHALTLL